MHSLKGPRNFTVALSIKPRLLGPSRMTAQSSKECKAVAREECATFPVVCDSPARPPPCLLNTRLACLQKEPKEATASLFTLLLFTPFYCISYHSPFQTTVNEHIYLYMTENTFAKINKYEPE